MKTYKVVMKTYRVSLAQVAWEVAEVQARSKADALIDVVNKKFVVSITSVERVKK